MNRPATTWLNYPGDVRPIDPTTPMGPTYEGAYLVWPVTAEYDPQTDRSRVGLSYIAPTGATS